MSAHETAAREHQRAPDGQPVDPAADVCVACVLPCVPTAAMAARSVVVQALTGRVDRRVLADAELVVCELVTNSVRHAGLTADEFVRVRVAVSDGVMHMDVENPGAAGTIAARRTGSERSGFGLRIIETLADAWGVSREGHTRVWAELACWPA